MVSGLGENRRGTLSAERNKMQDSHFQQCLEEPHDVPKSEISGGLGMSHSAGD